LKFRKAELFRNIFPNQFHRHITEDLFGFTADNVGDKLGTFFQLYDGNDIGKIFPKSRVKGLVVNDEGEHRSFTGRFDVCMGNRMASGADEGRGPANMFAVITFLEG
jgi:hypothetical protein